MRVKLNEAMIRSLVRESIARRMLQEQEGVPELDPAGILSLLGGGAAAGAQEEREKLGKYVPSGRQRGEDVIEAIAKLVGGQPGRDQATGAAIIDQGLGRKIQAFITDKRYVNRPFTVTDSSSVLEEWSAAASSVPPVPPIGADGKPDTSKDTITFPPNADGLLRYLIVVENAELGSRAMLADLSRGTSDYQTNLKSVVGELVEIINGVTYASDLRSIATKVHAVAKDDNTSKMIRTKSLLAGFARENLTTYEALAPAGMGILAAGLVVALVYTGGAALAAASPLVTSVWGAPATASLFAGLTAATLALGAATAWGFSAVFESSIEVFNEEPYADVVAHINDDDQSYLDELALEVERTVFPFSRQGASFRDRLASTLRRISESEPQRSLIVQELTDLVGEEIE